MEHAEGFVVMDYSSIKLHVSLSVLLGLWIMGMEVVFRKHHLPSVNLLSSSKVHLVGIPAYWAIILIISQEYVKSVQQDACCVSVPRHVYSVM